jgi:hypothetical protein
MTEANDAKITIQQAAMSRKNERSKRHITRHLCTTGLIAISTIRAMNRPGIAPGGASKKGDKISTKAGKRTPGLHSPFLLTRLVHFHAAIYLNKKPDEPLDLLRAEFIKYILSKDGQTLTEKGGYFPRFGANGEKRMSRGVIADNILALRQAPKHRAAEPKRDTPGPVQTRIRTRVP